jgi:hypothetical protein
MTRPEAAGGAARARRARPLARRLLDEAAAAARRRYGRRPNVVGVGVGTKLVGGAPTDVHDSIQFFVRRKTRSRARTRAPLPAFVWAEGGPGGRTRRRKVVTDVIEVGRVDFACRAGTAVGTTGRTGVAALVFRNKAAAAPGFYLITCAHVVGRLGNPGVGEQVTGECCGADVLATTVAMTGIDRDRVRYDIAVARLTDACTPQPDCEVSGEPGSAVRRFVKGAAIRAGTTVRLALRGERNLTGGVVSVAALEVGGVLVENLCLTNIAVRFGDSGSLAYRDDAAIGILVARSATDGLGWFQPLGDALAYACEKGGIDVRCFED